VGLPHAGKTHIYIGEPALYNTGSSINKQEKTMSVISTEVEFILPMGFVDGDGNLHKNGVMRLATAGDEILPLKDHRVQSNPAYLSIIVLSRVIIKLGGLNMVNTKVIEDLYAADFTYLQALYNQINQVPEASQANNEIGMTGALKMPGE
jgi:hypothetical protein